MSEKKLCVHLYKLNKIIREVNPNLESRRVYIDKQGTTDKRPIGVPSIEYRVWIGMGAEYYQAVLYPYISKNQHGFMPNRSIATAMKQAYQLRLSHKYAYEFDLDGFFNRVEVSEISKELKEIGLPTPLINFTEGINNTPPKIRGDQIQKEKELSYVENNFMGSSDYKDIIIKHGLPQGLPGSPILCIFLASRRMQKLGLDPLMYADDGILFTNNKEDIEKLQNESLIKAGIILSKKNKKDGTAASKGIVGNLINFLGSTLDMATGYISSKKGRVHISKSLEEISKYVGNDYNQVKEGKWKIHSKSAMVLLYIKQTSESKIKQILEYCKSLVREYLFGKKSTLHINEGLIYDYTKVSTVLIEHLLKRHRINIRGKNINTFGTLYNGEELNTTQDSLSPKDMVLKGSGLIEMIKERESLISKYYDNRLSI